MHFAIFLRIFIIYVESNIFSLPEMKSQASAFLRACRYLSRMTAYLFRSSGEVDVTSVYRLAVHRLLPTRNGDTVNNILTILSR